MTESVETTMSQVIYTLTGSPLEVKPRVEELFSQYHPLGYGTRIVVVTPEKTVVSRYQSCD